MPFGVFPIFFSLSFHSFFSLFCSPFIDSSLSMSFSRMKLERIAGSLTTRAAAQKRKKERKARSIQLLEMNGRLKRDAMLIELYRKQFNAPGISCV
jgi:hypothetical protein